ncbi:UNVERIFIED_CONTAM: Receptor-like protein kinase HSL1 [Sesamum angustifolium]|uniref:non-specific serine/threonine protein kinase n=1 Tax=Sesamum angustifolium TaxID=2727405 RepID=A0AAW2IPE2_9LAMI
MYKDSFLGNPGLCGDIEGLCDAKEGKNGGYVWFLKSIFVLAGLVLIAGVVWFYMKYRKFREVKQTLDRSKWTLMSFHKLGFSEAEILDALDEDNVIGSGASGKVYKVVLSNGEVVAVKKLWGKSKLADESSDLEKCNHQDDGFDAEVGTLGKIRHKNIVKLWCCCTTRDSKLLVYEYMPNGSLGDLLHSTKSGLLDWSIRFKIAMDAAEGLSYLHHDCVPPIVHRDVKSNNILLDADYGARVADFGVAKVVDADGKGTKSMSVIAGSCGYIAPENNFSGVLPEEIGFLDSLMEFSGNDNKFSGSLPGEIPGGIGELAVLNYLDLSGNRFSGKIPAGLQNLKLNRLNLSYNHLAGDIPPLYAKGMYKDSFLGNPGLCGILRVYVMQRKARMGDMLVLESIFVLAGLVLHSWCCFGFYMKYRKFREVRLELLIDQMDVNVVP